MKYGYKRITGAYSKDDKVETPVLIRLHIPLMKHTTGVQPINISLDYCIKVYHGTKLSSRSCRCFLLPTHLIPYFWRENLCLVALEACNTRNLQFLTFIRVKKLLYTTRGIFKIVKGPRVVHLNLKKRRPYDFPLPTLQPTAIKLDIFPF